MATQPRLPTAATATKSPTACSGSHNGGTCAGSSYDDGILQLCADLHDNDAASMQTKVTKYVSTVIGFVLFFIFNIIQCDYFTADKKKLP